MGILGNCFKVHILGQFHVFCVNSKNLEPSNLIRNSYVDLPVESTESAQSWVNCIRPISSSNHNNMSSTFESVH